MSTLNKAKQGISWTIIILLFGLLVILTILLLLNPSSGTAKSYVIFPTQAEPSSLEMNAEQERYQGLIAFQSDREGGGIFLMDANGENIQRLSEPSLYESWENQDTHAGVNNWIAYTKKEGQNLYSYDVYITDSASGWTQALVTNPGPDLEPAWDPHSLTLAYVAGIDGNDEIHIYDVENETDHRLTYSNTLDRHPSWSPDGSQLVYWTEVEGLRQIMIADPRGNEITNLSDGTANDWDPVWVKPISITPGNQIGDSSSLYLQSRVVKCTEEGMAQIEYLAWDETNGAHPISQVQMEVMGNKIYDTGSIEALRKKEFLEIAITDYVEERHMPVTLLIKAWNLGEHQTIPKISSLTVHCSQINFMPANLSMFLPKPAFTASTRSATPIPYETLKNKIIFTSDRDGNEALYMMNPDGSRQIRIQEDPHIQDYYLRASKMQASSSDRRSIVYAGMTDKGMELYLYDAYSGLIYKITDNKVQENEPSFSPNNMDIVYSVLNQKYERSDLFIMNLVTMEIQQITHNTWETAREPSWSPNGKQIAYSSNAQTGHSQIWVINRDGTNPKNISDNPYNDWNPIWVSNTIDFSDLAATPTPLPTVFPTPTEE
jgi:Tol biopolymer transport system component